MKKFYLWMAVYALNLFTISACLFDLMRGQSAWNAPFAVFIFVSAVAAMELAIESIPDNGH